MTEPGPLSLDFLLARTRTGPRSEPDVDQERRQLLGRTGAAAALGVFALLVAELDKAIGYSASNASASASAAPTSTTTPTTPQTSGQVSGTRIGLTSSNPVGAALAFTDDTQGIPAYCVHRPSGGFIAFSAICTHAMHGGVQPDYDTVRLPMSRIDL